MQKVIFAFVALAVFSTAAYAKDDPRKCPAGTTLQSGICKK